MTAWKNDRVVVRAVDLGGRTPPSNLEAEAAVLSAVLCDVRALDETIATGLAPEEFYSNANERVFAAALELHAKGQPVDVQTVAAFLRDRDTLSAVGGVGHIAKLVDATPSVAHVCAHARIVREKARVRRAIEICQEGAATGYADYGEASSYIDGLAQKLCDLAQAREMRGGRMIYDVVRENIEDAARIVNGGALGGYPTGLRAVDERTGGLFRGELTVVAARPGMGKTALALDYAENIARLPGDADESNEGKAAFDGYAVHFFSYEMPDKQLAHRRICANAKLDVSRLRRGGELERHFHSYVSAANDMSQLPIWIYDDASLTPLQARAFVRAQQQKMPRRRHVAIFDYLHLMPVEIDDSSEERRLSAISRALKLMARSLSIPVVALSQLNRAVETRGGKDKRPQLSDLRGSGSIEQDADVIQFIYRPEYYDEKTENEGLAIIDIAKQRNGPTGDCTVAFRSASTHFEDPTERDVQRWSER